LSTLQPPSEHLPVCLGIDLRCCFHRQQLTAHLERHLSIASHSPASKFDLCTSRNQEPKEK
jgi:hypothetical protein